MFRKIQDQFCQVSKAICVSINQQILLPAIEIKFNEQPIMIFENKQRRGEKKGKIIIFISIRTSYILQCF